MTACFLSLFVRLSACLRLILCINILLFSLSQAFISFPPPCLLIFIRGLTLCSQLSLYFLSSPYSLFLYLLITFIYLCVFFFVFCSFIFPIFYLATFCSRDSSVSTVTGLRAGRPSNEISIPRGRICLSVCPPDQTSGAHPAEIQRAPRVFHC